MVISLYFFTKLGNNDTDITLFNNYVFCTYLYPLQKRHSFRAAFKASQKPAVLAPAYFAADTQLLRRAEDKRASAQLLQSFSAVT